MGTLRRRLGARLNEMKAIDLEILRIFDTWSGSFCFCGHYVALSGGKR